MIDSRDRRRFERAVERAKRPAKRFRSLWSWRAIGVLAVLVIVAVWVAGRSASRARIEPRNAVVAPPAGPVIATEPVQEASGQRALEVRQSHLRQLQPVLRTDAEKLSEIARRIRASGRVTDFSKDRTDNAGELRSLFVSHRVLSGDLQNHYQEYAQAKERLRRTVAEQEEEFRKVIELVGTMLSLPPGAEQRRLEATRALLEKCVDKGPGKAGTTVVDEDVRAAHEAFQADSDVAAHCESLKKRASGLAANAEKLSTEALALAGRTTLPGDCKYTKPD